MIDVIAFLIEHFQDFDACPPREDLGELLEEVGVSCAFPSTSLYFETPLQENVTEQPAKAHAEADKPKDNSTSACC